MSLERKELGQQDYDELLQNSRFSKLDNESKANLLTALGRLVFVRLDNLNAVTIKTNEERLIPPTHQQFSNLSNNISNLVRYDIITQSSKKGDKSVLNWYETAIHCYKNKDYFSAFWILSALNTLSDTPNLGKLENTIKKMQANLLAKRGPEVIAFFAQQGKKHVLIPNFGPYKAFLDREQSLLSGYVDELEECYKEIEKEGKEFFIGGKNLVSIIANLDQLLLNKKIVNALEKRLDLIEKKETSVKGKEKIEKEMEKARENLIKKLKSADCLKCNNEDLVVFSDLLFKLYKAKANVRDVQESLNQKQSDLKKQQKLNKERIVHSTEHEKLLLTLTLPTEDHFFNSFFPLERVAGEERKKWQEMQKEKPEEQASTSSKRFAVTSLKGKEKDYEVEETKPSKRLSTSYEDLKNKAGEASKNKITKSEKAVPTKVDKSWSRSPSARRHAPPSPPRESKSSKESQSMIVHKKPDVGTDGGKGNPTGSLIQQFKLMAASQRSIEEKGSNTYPSLFSSNAQVKTRTPRKEVKKDKRPK